MFDISPLDTASFSNLTATPRLSLIAKTAVIYKSTDDTLIVNNCTVTNNIPNAETNGNGGD